jgi:hypothetical protein
MYLKLIICTSSNWLRAQFFLEKISLTHFIKKLLDFVEPKNSLPWSQKPDIVPYRKPDEFTPYHSLNIHCYPATYA